MTVINKILEFIVGILDNVLPVLGLSPDFLMKIDSAFAWFIGAMQGASYFIPLDIFVACMATIIIIDNWSLVFRVAHSVIKLVRG